MKRKMKKPVFAANAPKVSRVLSTVNGPTLSHCVKGMSHPPKNSVAVIALTVVMFAYSAMKKSANRMPLYSV